MQDGSSRFLREVAYNELGGLPFVLKGLAKAFPGRIFFGVLFRQYPVARVVPPPLQASNVFAVDRQGEAKLISNAKELE